MAKIWPSQWRSIAPLVGRTAHQCLDRYEQLLDEAQGRKPGEVDEARRLRPGEMDPAPETKPARPDPVDMDDDERDMLAEARARLANTKGKKERRAARERVLAQGRRMAELQRMRELRAAGISTGQKRRRDTGADLAKEIPFQIHVPTGPFQVDKELSRQADFTSQQSLAAAQASLAKEQARAKAKSAGPNADAAARKAAAARDLPKSLDSAAAAQAAASSGVRPELQLPAPQVTADELDQIAAAVGAEPSTRGNAITAGLLLQATPATVAGAGALSRTPTTKEALQAAARNLAALTQTTTPLAGGANVQLEQTVVGSKRGRGTAQAATPNPLLARAKVAASVGNRLAGATPVAGYSQDGDAASVVSRGTVGDGGFAQFARKLAGPGLAALRAGLQNLPGAEAAAGPAPAAAVPQFAAQVASKAAQGITPDQADVDAQAAAAAAAAATARRLATSSAVRAQLPRPYALAADGLQRHLLLPGQDEAAGTEAAQLLIAQEAAAMMLYDSRQSPALALKGVPVTRATPEQAQHAPPLYPAELLAYCDALVEDALPADIPSVQQLVASLPDLEALTVDEHGEPVAATDASPETQAATLAASGHVTLQALQRLQTRVQRSQRAQDVKLGGFQKRAQAAAAALTATAADLAEAQHALAAFERLHADETAGAAARLAAAQAEATEAVQTVRELQAQYATLVAERQQLQAQLAGTA